MKPHFAFAPILMLLPYLFIEGLNRHLITPLAAWYLAIYGCLLIASMAVTLLSRTAQAYVLLPSTGLTSRVRFGLIMFSLFGFWTALEGSYDIYRLAHHLA